LRENLDAKEVAWKHFESALESVKPSLEKEETERYIATMASVKKNINQPFYTG